MQGYLRHLANFALIVRSGSLAAAAERSGSAVSVMSRSLSILEAYYGFSLAKRTPAGLVLTEQGRLVHAEASRIVAAGSAAMAIGKGDGMISGEVVFSAPREVLIAWLPERLADLVAAYPEIALKIVASDEILDNRRQRIDVVLRIGAANPVKDLDVIVDTRVSPVLAASPSVSRLVREADPRSPLPINYIKFTRFGSTDKLLLFSKTGQQPMSVSFDRVTSVTDAALGIKLAIAGAGAIACLRPSIETDLADGRLVELFPDHAFEPAALRLGYPAGERTLAAKVVLEWLAGSLARSGVGDAGMLKTS